MSRIPALLLVVTVALAQKVETQPAGRGRITRLETALHHLSVIELAEEVTQVAVGSAAYQVEWRDNKVFVQPVEPANYTNLFIWTRSGRFNYALVPSSVESMHFAIDQEAPPAPEPTRAIEASAASAVPAALVLEATPVRGSGATAPERGAVDVTLTDLYRDGDTLYLRYRLRNQARHSYHAAAPVVSRLLGAHNGVSLVPLRARQLVGEHAARLTSEAEEAMSVTHAGTAAREIAPGETALGLVAVALPPATPATPWVLKLEFPRHDRERVLAYLVP